MRLAIPDQADRTILHAAALLLAGGLIAGLYAPPLFWLLLGGGVAAGIIFLVYRHPTPFCVVWLVVASASLEMTLNDLIGPDMFQTTIAGVKATELVLAGLCALRFGLRPDGFNPAWGFLAMLIAGLAHGLYPGLTLADSLRSVIGSCAPFAFCFCRLPPFWGQRMLSATRWCPLLVVLGCIPLSLFGIRPLFIDSGGARLAGLGHPAFLANVCLPAIYACLIRLFRTGRTGDMCLLFVNLLILVLTGARAPLACGLAVTAIAFLSIRSTGFPAAQRLLLGLAIAGGLTALALIAGDFIDIRLFNVALHETVNLSGREMLWPEFEAAAAQSPWVGWGIGAGNLIVPPAGEIAQTLHTWAAHNEYLRILVEGGQLGRGLLIILFVAWVRQRTSPLCSSDRRIMRLAFLALACHAVTDNVLISTPACVLFAFATAVFACHRDQSGRLALPDSARLA